MVILKVYVTNITKVKEVIVLDRRFYEVSATYTCKNKKKKNVGLFIESEWNKVKSTGYYMIFDLK